VIVVDSNVVAYLYLPTVHTKHAEALFEREPDWVAPMLWRSELRNVLTGYLRRRLLSFEQAVSLQREAEAQFSGLEFEVASLGVLELARQSNCSAYDCEYMALALHLDVPLVTLDRKLLRAFPSRAVSLLAV
jgi:predicted nucleic acid-binding protein